jgi:2-polyprenyl-6-methoxyphenol hydroxylase-like FAD-dependent oxidoreductase
MRNCIECSYALDAGLCEGGIMDRSTVLICGAGVAGPTLAYWLARSGFAVTVVERAQGARSSGSPVDVRGDAANVAERMGVLDRLRAAGTHVTGLRVVDDDGRSLARLDLAASGQGGPRWVELPRAVLASVLYEAARDEAEFLFDDTVVALEQDPGGVEVTFDRAPPRRFDLVVGADGLHSAVRGLAFGPEADHLCHLGLYVASLWLDTPLADARDVLLYNTPGRAIAVHPAVGRPGALFMFRSPELPGFDHHDIEQHRRLLMAAFAGGRWRTPELLDRALATDDLFFDAVAAVQLSSWSVGRVGLLGDAAACASFLGDGSSLAMVGAATLAEELAATPTDPAGALCRFEARHRTRTDPVQGAAFRGSRLLVPATRPGIAVRNLGIRALSLVSGLRRRMPHWSMPVDAGRGSGTR